MWDTALVRTLKICKMFNNLIVRMSPGTKTLVFKSLTINFDINLKFYA